jgi:hypothetical protein
MNGGTCMLDTAANEYYCKCPPNVRGRHCQFGVKECKDGMYCMVSTTRQLKSLQLTAAASCGSLPTAPAGLVTYSEDSAFTILKRRLLVTL